MWDDFGLDRSYPTCTLAPLSPQDVDMLDVAIGLEVRAQHIFCHISGHLNSTAAINRHTPMAYRQIFLAGLSGVQVGTYQSNQGTNQEK